MAKLTLAIDDRQLREARMHAIDQDTTVSQMVREFLEDSVQSLSRRPAARRRLLSIRLSLPPVTWSRENLYER